MHPEPPAAFFTGKTHITEQCNALYGTVKVNQTRIPVLWSHPPHERSNYGFSVLSFLPYVSTEYSQHTTDEYHHRPR